MRLCEGDSARTFSAEELAVEAWKGDKPSCGLRSYENEHPDSNKLFKSIDSKGGLVVKGWHAVVREWLGDNNRPTTFGGAGQFWGFSATDPPNAWSQSSAMATAVLFIRVSLPLDWPRHRATGRMKLTRHLEQQAPAVTNLGEV
jgi:hypothetical protein